MDRPTSSLSIFFSLLLFLLFNSIPSSSSTTLDPSEQNALKSMKIPTTGDLCSSKTAACDKSGHLLSLHVANCSSSVSLSTNALAAFSSLVDLEFVDCPSTAVVRLPSAVASNLRTFTCINGLRSLTGVWLSQLSNVTDLTVSGVVVNASGPTIIFDGLKNINKVTISGTNLTGFLPKSWDNLQNLTYIDLSHNQLKGHIPTTISDIQSLISLDLSSNLLDGELPSSIGNLTELKNLSVASNALSGSIPESIGSLTSLAYLDLSSNQFNGSIPGFLAKMKGLKYLNLEKNNFHGVLPFEESFIKKLTVFKVGDNANMCYNKSTISSKKMKLGISPCDKNGFPISPATAPSPADQTADEGGDTTSADQSSSGNGDHHGPNKLVLGVAIALSSIVFLIIFLSILAKRCA